MRIVAIDFEGDAGDRGLTAMSLYSDQGEWYSTNVSDMEHKLHELAREEIRFIAHNAEYDCIVGFSQLGCDVRFIFNNGRFNHAEIKATGWPKIVHCWDTMILSGGLSVAKLGKAIGKPKYPTPPSLLNTQTLVPPWRCDRHNKLHCVECYAVRDAEIIYDFYAQYAGFLSTYGLEPKRTLASAAVDLWRVLDNVGQCNITSKRIDDFCRLSYHGGRTEVFKYGTISSVYTADVTSMYPYVMRQMAYPKMDTLLYNDSKLLNESILRFEGVSEADVQLPYHHVPCLPVEHEGKLYFPYGKLHGIWTNVELRYAKQKGAIINRIYRTVYSPKTCFPFQTFVDVLYTLRAEYKKADDPRQLTVKILLNALYGRLGLSREQERETIISLPPYASSEDYQGYYLELIKGRAYARKEQHFSGASKYSNVLWASYITAYARLKLQYYLESQGNNVIYCDTDSIYSQAPIETEGDGLGALGKPEYWDKGTFLGPKLYRLEMYGGNTLLRAKGVPQSVAADYLRTGAATFQAPFRVREALAQGETAGRWREVTKHQHLVPSKRQLVYPDWLESGMLYSDTNPVFFEPNAESEEEVQDE